MMAAGLAVPIWVVTPLNVSYSVTVVPIGDSPWETWPEMVCVAALDVSVAVAIVTVGGAVVLNVNTTGELEPTPPAASISVATIV